jgi:hypothetical protein
LKNNATGGVNREYTVLQNLVFSVSLIIMNSIMVGRTCKFVFADELELVNLVTGGDLKRWIIICLQFKKHLFSRK